MRVRVELSGYRYAYQELTVDAVASDVIGPSEARRYLGPQVGDALQIGGPVVLVRARLPRDEFVAGGQRYRYHDGMDGVAEVRLRSEPILHTLIPGLGRL
jgi:membrane fusion protein (multidrug efflux system)